MRSYVGLLSLARNDFEAITGKRTDRYFRQALGAKKVPSAETLRQRLDALPKPFRWAVANAATELVRRAGASSKRSASSRVNGCLSFPNRAKFTGAEETCRLAPEGVPSKVLPSRDSPTQHNHSVSNFRTAQT